MADTYTHVTDQTFGDVVLTADHPAIVDFWAPWCRPCLMMAPAFEALSKEYAGKLVFAKLNTDDNPATAGRFGIQGIPTLLIFYKGREIGRIVGAVPQDRLKKAIDDALAASV